jgi:uncharacterized protein (TIGR02722 family)
MICKQLLTLGFCAFLALGLSRCAKDLEGEYSDPNSVEIVDDQWNETDARTTAQAMVKGMLDRPWIKGYGQAHGGKKPLVVVDEVENRTDEHIDTKMLTEFIQDELINSGRVRFLDKAGRQKILDEIKYQESGAVAADKASKGGRQLGAQFILKGAMTSIIQQEGKLKVITYQTNLTLTNLETSELEWSEKKLIKKRMKRSSASW